MKRLGFVLILMLGIVSLLVIGCGGGGEGEEATPTATAAPGATATATPGVTPTPTPETGEELPESYKYTVVFSNWFGSTGTHKVWVKGDKQKVEISETELGVEEWNTICISREDHDYIIEDNTAMEYPSGSGMCPTSVLGILEESYTIYPSEAAALADMKAECATTPTCHSMDIAGHEPIAGVTCTIFEGIGESPEGAEVRGKVWLVIDKGWTLKMEWTMPEGTQTREFEELDLNPTIPDTLFELPPDVEIIEWR